ncbi:MAG: GyrI-like domain-containing protein [Treponema sp.]|nr:GyrI-like domain-containing protein [Treponema sp.]
MSKLINMRGIEIKKFRAVSSGSKTLNEIFGNNGFSKWLNEHRHLLKDHMYEPAEFLWHEGAKETWGHGQNIFISAIKDEVTEADVAPYNIFEFPGGLFLVATGDEKDSADLNETINCMMGWIKNNDIFEYGDFPKSGMCNMPNPDGAFDIALGIAQQQIYLPLKLRKK